MITLKLSDGTSFTATGREARESVETFQQVLHDQSRIADIQRTVHKIKHDTHLIVRAVVDDYRPDADSVMISGTRLKQFVRTRELLQKHTDWTLYRAATQAFRDVKGPGGYPSVASLHRYCLEHVRTLVGPGTASR